MLKLAKTGNLSLVFILLFVANSLSNSLTPIFNSLALAFLAAGAISLAIDPQFSRDENSSRQRIIPSPYVLILIQIGLVIYFGKYDPFALVYLSIFTLLSIYISVIAPEQMLRAFYNSTVVLTTVGFVAHITDLFSFVKSDFFWNLLGDRFSGFYGHSNTAGLVLLFAYLIGKKNQNKLPLQILLVTAILFTEQRIVIAMLLLLLCIEFRDKLFKYIVLISPLLFFFVSYLSSDISLVRSEKGDITTGRSYIWETCIQISNSQSHLGGGQNYINETYAGTNSRYIWFNHCHNQVLDDLVNFGFIYTLLFLVIISLWVLKNYGNLKSLYGYMLFSLTVISLVETPLRIWHNPRHLWVIPIIGSIAVIGSRPVRRESLYSDEKP